jgi:plasmid stabilization system protein ParE
MAEEQPLPQVSYSTAATRDLHNIWIWNADTHGVATADQYEEFLKKAISLLRSSPKRVQRVPHKLDLQYVTAQQKPRRHGHVIVFKGSSSDIEIVRIFHTAQDWANHIDE